MNEDDINPTSTSRGPTVTVVATAPIQVIVNQKTEALLLIDNSGTVRYASPDAGTLFGRPVADLIGSPFGFPLGGAESAELEIVRPNSTVAIVEMHVEAVAWEGGHGFMATLHDISDRKRAEQVLIESQQFLRSTLDALSAQIAILDSQGTILAVNQAWQEYARQAGYDPYLSGVGYNYLSVCDTVTGPDLANATCTANGIRAVIDGRNQSFYLEYACISNDCEVWFAMRVTRFISNSEIRVVVAHEDVTEHKVTERIDEDRRHILELVARNQDLTVIGAEILTMIGHYYPDLPFASLAIGDLPIQYTHVTSIGANDFALLDSLSTRHIARLDNSTGFVVASCTTDAPDVQTECNELAQRLGLRRCWIAPINTASGALIGMLTIGRRLTGDPGPRDIRFLELVSQLLVIAQEQDERTHQLAYQAHHDALTGLPNRLLFEDRLGKAIDAARRNCDQVAVLFIDLDRFKQINDTLGHAVGDALLIQVARRLESCIRASDTLARRGGDEFMLVLSEINNSQQVARVAERLHDLLRLPFTIGQHELFVSASIGASIYPTDGENADTLQRSADSAMYRAKRTLRNSFQFFDPVMNQTALEHLSLENHLRRAIERKEFTLHYQPQCDPEGRIVGLEALLRWNHPELGTIPPARFIPLAEELGLILPIGEWCLREACRQLYCWLQEGLKPIPMAVNVSPIQFSQPGFVTACRSIISSSKIDPTLIQLEITESTLMGNAETVTHQIGELHALGLTLAIDDFGTGYSSLGYLQRLPIGVLKIDRTFISALDTVEDCSSTRAIVSALVTLGHHLNMLVIAEGVETNAQLDFLSSISCDQIQGYLFSRPLPAEQFAPLLRAGRVRAANDKVTG